eukprot:CAMPEP_0194523486 /NCGR_PEP_ID=MMETSP0253-20130528/58386_1 /TAXON_ID=2966 /ORGANISM="Noctiluca scintillans" /LENGTH=189 /DNA_ID=CAMNT_0039368029 /DNA_START=119 /DNA_END=688 /DNA_ORIENTATION=+
MSKPLDSAIETVGDATIDWLRRQDVPVVGNGTAVHVALRHGDQLVEAIPPAVQIVTATEFFGRYPPGTLFFEGTLPYASDDEAERASHFGFSKVGLPYATNFYPPTRDSEVYYCSSLVDYAYRNATGRDLVFTEEPFTLIFEPVEFWSDYYHQRNMSVPNVTGSNPTLLLHSASTIYRQLFPKVLWASV